LLRHTGQHAGREDFRLVPACRYRARRPRTGLRLAPGRRYDLVITDLGREHSSAASATAGAAFLDQPIVRNGGPPVIVYAGTWAVAQREQLVRRGALDVMANRAQLFTTVLGVLGRSPPTGGDLER
jgi:hypothetical protein